MAQTNDDQRDFWSSRAGDSWTRNQDLLDAVFAPVLTHVLDAAALRAGQKVLDIGCGAGTSSVAAGARVGPEGAVLGLDISAPLLDRAREIAAGQDNVTFRLDDAQDAELPQDHFDALISRFGVMFFADPVAAFTNFAQALRPGARMVFAAWGPPKDNPFFTLPHKVAASRLGRPPSSDPLAPGPFAFHDTDRTLGFLRDAGFADAQADPLSLRLGQSLRPEELANLGAQTGAAKRVVDHFGGSEADLAAIEAELTEIYRSDEPGLDVALWLYHATAPA